MELAAVPETIIGRFQLCIDDLQRGALAVSEVEETIPISEIEQAQSHPLQTAFDVGCSCGSSDIQ